MSNEQLVMMYQNTKDKKWLDEIINSNQKLVKSIARKFYTAKTSSIDYEDIEQEGFVGLIVASNKYDFNKVDKAKFSTYAVYWIYQKISFFINSKNTNEEISLYSPLGKEDDSSTLMDTLEDDGQAHETTENNLLNNQLRSELDDVMSKVNSLREREILKFIYGWDSEPVPAAEVAEIFDISEKHVSSIKIKAIEKLKRSGWGRAQLFLYYKEKYGNPFTQSQIINKIDKLDKFYVNKGGLI